MGPFPHDAPARKDQQGQPGRHRRLRVRRVRASRAGKACRAVRRAWAMRRSPGTGPRTSPSGARATSTTSSMPSRARMPCASSRSTAPARRPWPGASSMPSTPSTMPSPRARRPMKATTRRSTFRRSSASAARCSISSRPTARRARPTTPNSNGWASAIRSREGVGFYYLDHLTHNVYRGNMDKWWAFYRELFGFKQIHFFDIDGKHHRPGQPRDHLALRQDPHPAQRIQRTTTARSRNICGNTRAKASSTSPSAPRTSTTPPTGLPPTA